MKTPLAWLNLWHNPARTAVAIAGVAFAVALMFMQLGFLEAVRGSATIIYDALEFDVCLRSPDYLHLADARSIPRARLTQAHQASAVAAAVPLHVELAGWLNPTTREKRGILLLGVQPAQTPFRSRPLARQVVAELRHAEAMLVDTRSAPDFGPLDGRAFGPRDLSRVMELGGRRLRIAGLFTRGAGLTASGAAVVNEPAFAAAIPGRDPQAISLGLIQLRPGADVGLAVRELRHLLPPDVEVLSRADVVNGEVRRWVHETNYGLIFQTGVAVAVLVGMAIVYQVLASDVANLLPEYATLKAIGYTNRFIGALVLQQAAVLAVAGFAVGLAAALGLYSITEAGARIPIRMTEPNLWIVLGLTMVICLGSGLFAVRKTFDADPAELF